MKIAGSCLMHMGDADSMLCGNLSKPLDHLHQVSNVIGLRYLDAAKSIHILAPNATIRRK